MNDSENQRYCGWHGKPLDNEFRCDECAKVRQERIKKDNEKNIPLMGSQLDEQFVQGRTGDMFREQVEKGVIENEKWFKDYKYKPPTYMLLVKYFCDRCKFVNFHQLNYCPKCGGNFVRRKMSANEFYEKYGDYRAGY